MIAVDGILLHVMVIFRAGLDMIVSTLRVDLTAELLKSKQAESVKAAVPNILQVV